MNRRFLSPFLCLLLMALLALSLKTGSGSLDVTGAIRDWLNNVDSVQRTILLEVRLPRSVLALLLGAAMGLSGAVMQGMLQNPLAEPHLLGMSNGAALGGVIALYFGLAAQFALLLPLLGVLSAGLATLLVFLLAGANTTANSIILAGVAINAFYLALIAMILNFAPNPYAISEIVSWLLGSAANKTFAEMLVVAPLVLFGMGLLLSRNRFLNALTLGEESAASLGFNITRERLLVGLGLALTVGASVASIGAVGFIGLIIPNLLRPLVKYSPSALLLVSALAGACLALFADLLVQWIPTNQELKMGAITALLGAPFFFYLVISNRQEID